MLPRTIFALTTALALLGVSPLAAATGRDARSQQIMVMLSMPPPHLRTGSGYSGGYGEDASRGSRQRAAARIARAHGLSLVESWPMPSLAIECFIMTVPEGLTTEEMVRELSGDPAVEWSEPVALYQGLAASTSYDDPLYAAQPAAREWRLDTLHRHLTGLKVTIAVIDSGVDARQPDLAGQIVLERNFTERADAVGPHGTAVAGIIAAKADNKVGIVGVAPEAKILALRACSEEEARTLCDTFSLAKAIDFASARKSPIINLSLSGPPGRLLSTLLSRAIAQGTSVVAARDPQLPDGGFPASLPGVIAVTDKRGARRPTIVYHAPGEDIPAPQPGGQWTLVNGSSFSAAHVSGLLALLRQRDSARSTPLATGADGTIDICATFGAAACGDMAGQD